MTTATAQSIRSIFKAHGVKARVRTEGRTVNVRAINMKPAKALAIVEDLTAANLKPAHISDEFYQLQAQRGHIDVMFAA